MIFCSCTKKVALGALIVLLVLLFFLTSCYCLVFGNEIHVYDFFLFEKGAYNYVKVCLKGFLSR